MKKIILLLSIFILFGCSGSSDDLPAEEPPINVVAIGDSTISTFFYDTNKLKINLPALSTVTTYGSPGQCAIDGQLHNLNIITSTPKGSVVIFLSGINDARRCGTSVDKFKSLVIDLHNATVSSGSKFVIITPNPTFSFENHILTQYANAERSLNYNLADLRSWIEDPTMIKPFNYAHEVRVDGTHMTPIIYDWLSPKLAQVIKHAK